MFFFVISSSLLDCTIFGTLRAHIEQNNDSYTFFGILSHLCARKNMTGKTRIIEVLDLRKKCEIGCDCACVHRKWLAFVYGNQWYIVILRVPSFYQIQIKSLHSNFLFYETPIYTINGTKKCIKYLHFECIDRRSQSQQV